MKNVLFSDRNSDPKKGFDVEFDDGKKLTNH